MSLPGGHALIVCALAASGCSAGAAETDAGVQPDARVALDATTPCLGCIDAGGVDASLGARATGQLDGCNGAEGCHVSAAGGLSFPFGDETRYLLNVPSEERPALVRVRPGDPSNSYLFLKVQGDGGIDGGRMPLGAAYDPRIPALVFDWIEAGAPLQ